MECRLPANLTVRETQVYCQAICGRSSKEIAAALGMSPRTVKFHLSNVFRKCGVATRLELAISAKLKAERVLDTTAACTAARQGDPHKGYAVLLAGRGPDLPES